MRKHLRRILGPALAALALLALPAAADEALVRKGDALYRQFCAHCHGPNMVNPGVSSFDLRKFPRDDKARFVQSVMQGKGNMPAWADVLHEDELEAIWAYVATRGGREPMPQAAAPAPPAPETAEAGTLRVCLARNGGAMSGWRASGGVGLDYRVAKALAGELGLALAVTWYESENEEESEPVREAQAMLAHGLCDLVAGHILTTRSVGAPLAERARPPRWTGLAPNLRPPMVRLRPIAATRPYARIEMGLVLGPAVTAEPASLRDLAGYRLGVAQGTLAGIVSLKQVPEPVRAASTLHVPGPGFLWAMEKGEFDVALVSVPDWDFHARQNRVTKLRLAAYRHPLGFNIGFALPADRPGLLAAADAVLERLDREGRIAALAAEDGLHYAPPRAPFLAPPLTLRDILAAD